jgi:hypothetical protein
MLKRLRHSERRHATGICTPYSHLYATSVHSFPELKTSQKLLCGVVKKADIWDSHSFNQHGIYPRLSTTHPSPPPINPPPPQWLCSSPAGLYRPPLPPVTSNRRIHQPPYWSLRTHIPRHSKASSRIQSCRPHCPGLGGARGLGLTQSEALLEPGATVYVLDRLLEPSPEFFTATGRAKRRWVQSCCIVGSK